jgi:N-acetylglucosamine-6-phosphate deacetylase
MTKHHALTHCTLWPGDGSRRSGHVVLKDGIIESVGDGPYRGDLPAENLDGLCLSPGLIDLMVCGACGRTLDQDDPGELLRDYIKLGVTSCQMCTGTLPWDTLERIGENVRRYQTGTHDGAARFLGVYWEGPFMVPKLAGASLGKYTQPASRENVARLLELGRDATTMVNVSPGAEQDIEGIRALRDAGTIVSMAHADSTPDHVEACIEAGTSILGHVWNNNLGSLAEPGVQCPTIDHVGLTDERIKFVHMICDGTHVHPVIMRLVLRCKGLERICIVTDALPGAGCPDGGFPWPDGRTFHKSNGVHRTPTGQLAGSGLLLADHLRNFIRVTGVPAHEAIRAVTLNPAVSLGLDQEIGILAPGRQADLALWDSNVQLRRVWRNGKKVEPISNLAEITLP